MALALLVPVAFLLFLLAMERVEARLLPEAPPGEGEVGSPVEVHPDDALATPVEVPVLVQVPVQPGAGALAVPAAVQ